MNERTVINCELDRNVEENARRLLQALLRHMMNDVSQYGRCSTDEPQHLMENGVSFLIRPHIVIQKDPRQKAGWALNFLDAAAKRQISVTLPVNRSQE
jgi:hypothetical protein